MKKHFLFYVVLLSGMLPALISCRRDDSEDADFLSADDAGVLVSNLVFTDDDDNITGYATGYGFNEADPGEVSIPCETLEQARELFRSWLTRDADVSESDGVITWKMTGMDKKSQGNVVLRPGGEKGAVAHLELPAGFPVISKVLFLPAASLPLNAELDFADILEDFYFGNVINVLSPDFSKKELTHGSGAMVVIREYDQDTNTSGILMALPPHAIGEGAYYGDDVFTESFKRSRTLSELQGPIGQTYIQYSKFLNPIFKSLGYKDGDRWFCCTRDHRVKNTLYNISSKKDDGAYYIKSFAGISWGKTYYECWAYFFTVEKSGSGYRVALK